MSGSISDCRGWGRYTGNIYTGRVGKRLVVVATYAPDAAHEARNDKRGDYSQRLGQRAAVTADGTTVKKWKPGATAPKPTAEQTQHPKRLLFSDLAMHLQYYAYGRAYQAS